MTCRIPSQRHRTLKTPVVADINAIKKSKTAGMRTRPAEIIGYMINSSEFLQTYNGYNHLEEFTNGFSLETVNYR